MNPAGRAILKPCHYQPEFEPVDEDYPLQLSTGRRPLHFHTRTKTGRTRELQEADPEPYVQISEKDAKRFNISEGDLVVVESRRGKIEVAARVGLMATGQVFIPFHFGYFDEHKGRARAANELTRRMCCASSDMGFERADIGRTMGSCLEATPIQVRSRACYEGRPI